MKVTIMKNLDTPIFTDLSQHSIGFMQQKVLICLNSWMKLK